MYTYFLIFLLSLLPTLSHAQDENVSWSKIDRLGLYDNAEEGQLSKNVWENYNQAEAIDSLNRLPKQLSSPVYRTIIKRLLLSSSPTLDNNIDSPALLTKRLELLIRYGLLQDAKKLIEKIPDNYDFANNVDMALLKMQISLFDSELAPACLDIQASSDQFRNMPAWRELSDFCRYRFANAEKINMSNLQFNNYPALKNLLIKRDLNYSDLSPLELLLAKADGQLFSDDSYYKLAPNLSIMPDFLIYVGSDDEYKNKATYQCFAIEAAKRGIRDSVYIENAYKSASFNDEILTNNSGQVKLHPCDVSAFFYKKLLQVSDASNKDVLINAFLKTTEAIPAYALVPFKDYILDANISPDNKWRAASILGLSSESIPASLLPEAMPLKQFESQKSIAEKNYIDWVNNKTHENILVSNQIDIAAPLYIIQILSDEYNKLKNNSNKNLYENIFSLTYEKNSLNLGLGFAGFLSETFKNKDQVAVLTRSLHLVGENYIGDYSIEDVAVILSTLKAYKLEKEGVLLAFEYLQ